MNLLLSLAMLAAGAGPLKFQRHQIDDFPAGYQVALADLNGDGKPDVIALSTDADRVDWYENPTWQRRPVARTKRNIDLALHDLDGDGRPEIALASGFYFAESDRGGEIQWLSRPASLEQPWVVHPIAVDPVVHRLRWGDLHGDGRKEIIHAPLFSRGSKGPAAPQPAHLWAFRVPQDLAHGKWEPWPIDESLTVLHGLYVADLDGDGRDEILTASFEGICRFDFDGDRTSGKWRKTHIAAGFQPAEAKPGASRGSSELAPGQLGPKQPFLAAIEPWHGHEVVLYRPEEAPRPWRRRVLDTTLSEGHALVVADFDGDGVDEVVAGWRGKGGGLVLYQWRAADAESFQRIDLDRELAVEGAVAADINGDGRLDLVVIAGRSNKLVWYENQTPR